MAKRRRGGAAAETGGGGCLDDAVLARAIETWFVANARVLPWRTGGMTGGAQRGPARDPYWSLVSEAMLQQTQVSRVVEKFRAFVERFPTVVALAEASERDVLGMWSGLGYYRRARNLHAAARMIVDEFGGGVPREADALRALPGVGRYTAGAIASIAYGEAAPIVDGNVARVLLRVHGKDAASDDKRMQPWLWERAEALVRSAASPGVFNEGLMELGALVCVPGRPACETCPVRNMCVARREGKEAQIPRAKSRAKRREVFSAVAVVTRTDGAVLLEQRGESGMWAGMWQAPTLERSDRPPTAAELGKTVGIRGSLLRRGETFEFLATHRKMAFEVYLAAMSEGFNPRRGKFFGRAELGRLGMSTPQKRAFGLMK